MVLSQFLLEKFLKTLVCRFTLLSKAVRVIFKKMKMFLHVLDFEAHAGAVHNIDVVAVV
jgi:hypothetical protein